MKAITVTVFFGSITVLHCLFAAFKLVVHSRNGEYIMSMIIDLSCLDCLFLTAFWMLQGILKSTISVFLLAFWVKIMNPPPIYT